MSQTPIRQGHVYWLADCPPLDGATVKDSPVIVISPRQLLIRGGEVAVVAVTTKPRRNTDPDMVKLPNKHEMPNTTSGLSMPCWAIPRWFLAVSRDRLREPVGYISGSTLRRVVAAVEVRRQRLHKQEGDGT